MTEPRVLSEKETKLLDFIKEHDGQLITVDSIRNDIGDEYVGGLGRLVQNGLITKTKQHIGTAPRMVKCYSIKKNE